MRAMSFGVNAKIIRRVVGKFAGAWGFGIDAGFQMRKGNWRFGAVAKDITTTFNAWSFKFTEKKKKYCTLPTMIFLQNQQNYCTTFGNWWWI